MNTKPIQERIVLDRFRQCCPEFPRGKIIQAESPDFRLHVSPKHSIGIELTALPAPAYRITRSSLRDFIAEIRSRLTLKEDKLILYRKNRFREYWLILYADSIEVKGAEKEMEDLHFENQGYHRIFLFEMFNGRIYRLKKSQP